MGRGGKRKKYRNIRGGGVRERTKLLMIASKIPMGIMDMEKNIHSYLIQISSKLITQQ